VVAVTDVGGGLLNRRGLDVKGLLRHVVEERTVAGFPGGEPITNDDLLALDVDVPVPAALEGVIHEGNASRVRAKLIVEGANHPLTPGADDALERRGVPVVPDILANAGGVVVSYFEWVQNLQQLSWEEAEVNERLARILTGARRETRDRARAAGVSLRTAAFMIAIDRVWRATKLRGI